MNRGIVWKATIIDLVLWSLSYSVYCYRFCCIFSQQPFLAVFKQLVPHKKTTQLMYLDHFLKIKNFKNLQLNNA